MAAMHRTAHHPLPSCRTRSTPPEPAWFQRFFAVSFAQFRSVPFSTVSVSFHRSFHFPRSLGPLYLSLLFAHGTKRRDREWHPAGLSHPPANPRHIPSLPSEIFRFHDNYCRSISLWFYPSPFLRAIFCGSSLFVSIPAPLPPIFQPPTSEIRVPKIAANAR